MTKTSRWERADAQRWWDYVQRHSVSPRPIDIGEAMGVNDGTVGRWSPDAKKMTRPDADRVVNFARTFERSPIEALIEAGYLDQEDANNNNMAIELVESLKKRSADELLGEIRSRIPEESTGSGNGTDADHLSEYLATIGDPSSSDGFKKSRKRA